MPPHPPRKSAATSPRTRGEVNSVRPDHLEHVYVLDLEIIAPAAGAHDRVGQGRDVDAVLDHGLVDIDRDHLAERQPALHLLAVGTLQLDDLGHLALERYRAFGHPGHI